ncbi:hypothetical protein PESP_b0378 [Pseudoalteromonas espejiana DSM 9414]|nr:hypothetical protein PESP_b0378 [Pseudoalteromonas espejiana DSM 9414]
MDVKKYFISNSLCIYNCGDLACLSSFWSTHLFNNAINYSCNNTQNRLGKIQT